MFKILLKHEWKATWKINVLINGIFIAIAIFGCILFACADMRSFTTEHTLSFVGYMCIYGLSIFALFTIVFIYLLVRFYKSMYSREGYLTNTLPVSHHQLLLSKLIVSVFWMSLSGFLMLLSVFMLVFAGIHDTYEFAREMRAFLDKILENQVMILPTIITFTITIILSSIVRMLSYYFCFSLGQLSVNYKVVYAIVAMVAMNFIENFVGQFFSFFSVVLPGTRSLMEKMLSSYSSFLVGINGINIFLIILAVLFYFGNAYIIHNKLNLQ